MHCLSRNVSLEEKIEADVKTLYDNSVEIMQMTHETKAFEKRYIVDSMPKLAN